MSESHSSEHLLAESSRQIELLKKRLQKDIRLNENCTCNSGTGDDHSDHVLLCVVMWRFRYSDTDTSVVSCRLVRPASTWYVAPPAANAAPVALRWCEIVVAPVVRLSLRCSVLTAASEWCRMERRTAQHCSSRFCRESVYMQAFVLGPVSVDDVCGGCWIENFCSWICQLLIFGLH